MIKRLAVDLENLKFDPHNPRVIPNLGGDQDKLFRYLITEIGVDDLLESLSASGLFNADPIIAKAIPGGDDFYVIEGNRRLAALKLLSGYRPTDNLPIPKLPEVLPAIRASFSPVNIETDWPANQLQSYLGYKHVTASRVWSPDAKAKFVFENANGDLSQDSLRRFARSLGTKYPALVRWLTAFLVLRQAENAGIFDPQDAPSKGYFGTFYTLLGGKHAKDFLNLPKEVTVDPIPLANLTQLGEFLGWTVGTTKSGPKVNSRDQEDFEAVLASPNALEHFRARGDVESSLLYTEYSAEEIATKLQKCAYEIDDCVKKLFDVRNDEHVQRSFKALSGAFEKARHNMAMSVAGV